MTDGISITDLEQKVEVLDNDNFAVDNGANTNKVTAKQLKDYMELSLIKKAGDTMSGALKIPTADLAADDTTAVNREWVAKKEQTRISNCLTKIPQDIKLELSNGTLTLKAGSKVYKGDGSAVSINSDTVLYVQTGFMNTKGLVFYNPSSDDFCPLERCFSGETSPTVTGNTNFWYDTAAKIVKYTNNKGETWNDFSISLPLAVVTVGSNGTITSIDQVFNGFGFIGNVAFILPGVECLCVNGRNADGSLNSVITKISAVTIPSLLDDVSRTEIYISGTNSAVIMDEGAYSYDALKNYFFFGSSTRSACFAFSVTRDDTGRILSLTPQTVFHAVDYNEIKRADYVIETYSDDSGNWYRVYKSGWVEQGGIITANPSNTNRVTFLKPFTNAKYSFFRSNGTYSGTSSGFADEGYGQRTETYCEFYAASNHIIEICWYAIGKGA